MYDPVELDVVGAIEGNDKSSTVLMHWDYLRQYEPILAEFRDDEIVLMEVGLAKGASLRLWKWFFPNATIVGLDILERCRSFAGDRVVIEIGSQADRNFMTDVCTRFPPTVFIDDGSHLAEHNIVTFETVFPHLRPGGIYIVEDLAVHFGPGSEKWQTSEKRDSPGYFMDLALNHVAIGKHQVRKSVNAAIAQSIDSITFVGSAAIIRKTRAPRSVERGLEAAEAYLGTHPVSGESHLHLAGWILHHHGSLDRAQKAVDDAVAAGETGAVVAVLQAKILRGRGRKVEALPVLRAEADVCDKPYLLRDLAFELAACGGKDDAILVAEKALGINPNTSGAQSFVNRLRAQQVAAVG